MSELRPVKIVGVGIYDGKLGWFHCFGTRSYTPKNPKGQVMQEPIGIIELESGKVLQLSVGRFEFLDSKRVEVEAVKKGEME